MSTNQLLARALPAGSPIGLFRGRPIFVVRGGDETNENDPPTPADPATMTLDAIDAELPLLQTRAAELDALDAPTADDTAEADALIARFAALETAREPLATRAAGIDRIRAAALTPTNRTPGDATTRTPGSTQQRTNPYELDVVAMRAGAIPLADVRSRALTAIEIEVDLDDATKQHITQLLQVSGRSAAAARMAGITRKASAELAAHILTTGTETYRTEFEAYLADPQGMAGRAALSLTSANGGYLVPFTLDPTIILTNAGSANPFREISAHRTTSTNAWNGVTSAGVNAGWLAEGAEASDNSPTVGNISIVPQKAAAWVYGSYEILEDSDFASQLPDLLADAKDRLEENAFAVGTGSGQPYGVVTRATTVASGSAATYAVGDVYKVQQALPARWRGPRSNVNWVANLAVINATRQFDVYGGSSFWANLGMDQPEELLGKGIHESTSMASTPATTGAKTLVLGDFSQYLIVDRIGMSVLYEPLVKGSNQRPTGQAGWFAFWRVGADVTTSNAFRVLTIA